MSNFIKSANLPEKRIKTVLIGRHDDIIKKLNDIGIETVVLEDNTDIDISVGNHADMAALHLGGNRIFLDRRQTAVAEKLTSYGFDVTLTSEKISGKYPDDVRLNCALVGDNLIMGKKGYEPRLSDERFNKVFVNQGYCKCSTCVLNENVIITDDESIYKACKDLFDVLLIKKGDIRLKNQDYGFIGGACTKLDKDTVMFFGSLKYHRNGDEIKDFLSKHGLKYFELFDGQLMDIGSVVAIEEE